MPILLNLKKILKFLKNKNLFQISILSVLIIFYLPNLNLIADPPTEYDTLEKARSEALERLKEPSPKDKIDISPRIAALLGIIPGMGHAYLGDYTTAGIQFGLYAGIESTRNHFSSQKDYISNKDRDVTFKTEDVLIGYGFQKAGLTYTDTPLPVLDNFNLSETKFERDLRLYKEKQIAEQNTYIKYGDYTRTSRSTYYSDLLSNPSLSMSLYSIYSSYRDAGGLGEYKKSENIQELAYAPFNPNILKLPYVYAPIIFFSALAGFTSITDDGSNPTIGPESLKKDGSLYAGSFINGISPAIGEEAFFRGYLNQRLSMSYGTTAGLGISSTLFMLAHEGNTDATDGRLARFLGGVYLGYIHMKHGYDLRPSIATHFWWNFIIGISQIAKYKSDPNYDKSQREVFFMPISYTLQLQ